MAQCHFVSKRNFMGLARLVKSVPHSRPMDTTITEIRRVLKYLASTRGLSAFYRRHKLAPRTMARVKKKGWQASESTLTEVVRAIEKDRRAGRIPAQC